LTTVVTKRSKFSDIAPYSSVKFKLDFEGTAVGIATDYGLDNQAVGVPIPVK
jgi:hypothetical protein